MRQQTTVQFTPHYQPLPPGARRTQGRETVVDELSVEGRKVRRQDVRNRRAVRLGEQGVELDLDPFEPTRLPPQHRVEGVVALHHPGGERDELEFGCGDGENRARPGRGQQGLLDGEAVHRAPNAPDHQAVVCVHVDQPARDRVEPEVALDAGDRAGGRGIRAAESQSPQHGREPRLGGAVDQQVDVPLAAHPAGALPVPFPLEVGDAFVPERFAQALHQRAVGGERTGLLGGPGEGCHSGSGAHECRRVTGRSMHISPSSAGCAAGISTYHLATITYTTDLGRAKTGCNKCATSLGSPRYAAPPGVALNDRRRSRSPPVPRPLA